MSELSVRERDIFSLLVSEYISTALPIGSMTIAKGGGLGLSSATIRNVLARLEELGLLTHPHTSAGRIPTNVGFRYYINTIIEQRRPSKDEEATISGYLDNRSGNMDDMLKKTGTILSMMSNYTGLVVVPKLDNVVLKHVEFLPIATGKLLGILISRDGSVHNRIIEIDEDYTYPFLEKASNYCNKVFYGLTLRKAREKAVAELEIEQADYDKLVSVALLWSKEMFEDTFSDDLVIEGESKLFNAPEFTDVEKLRQVMEALDEKKKIVKLLNRALEGEEVCVFVGSESGCEEVSDCSIITTSYKKGGEVVGTLGVIGPMRMDYSRVISTVDFTAQIVSRMLEG